jgi:glycerol-3-phosphate dehydrogenase
MKPRIDVLAGKRRSAARASGKSTPDEPRLASSTNGNLVNPTPPLDRSAFLRRIADRREPWDIAVIGGGATGAGIAADAASRGYSVVLLEQHDFGKGTSSRSTKLVHGGVRYLQQGNLSLVMEALKERGLLLRNAPHLVHDLQFVVPNYQWWEAPFYGIGMKVYDLLAGKYGFGPSQILSKDEVLARIPTLSRDGLRGGVKYHDGQFDDARLLIDLIRTAAEHGACVLNYARVVSLFKNSDGFVHGLTFRDEESGASHTLGARCVINATGPFCDELRRADQPGAKSMIAPSQGVHIVLPREFLPGETAIMVPHTRDGRVMFAIPWHGRALVGTTDTPIPAPALEPAARIEEIDFIIDTAGGYLAHRPTRRDVLSVFTGIRPLVKTGDVSKTAALSRDHTVEISPSGLLTIAGGKWTTYRRMAEDAVDHAIVLGQLDERPCVTRSLPIRDPGIHEDSAAWYARHEMARTVEDVLARRTRLLFLDARAALAEAPRVARELAQELGRAAAWERSQLDAFEITARYFKPPP